MKWGLIILILAQIAGIAIASSADDALKALLTPPDRLTELDKLLHTVPAVGSQMLKLKHVSGTRTINANSNSIISFANSPNYIARDVTNFVGTARRSGYKGDIVIITSEPANQNFLERLQRFNASVFALQDVSCTGKSNIMCNAMGRSDMPVTLLRFFVFQEIAQQYNRESKILLSDFRDVIFQSDPFKYKMVQNILNHRDQLFVFQESHPNRVIGRDSQNAFFVSLCYGNEVARDISQLPISTSGIVIGYRDAIVAYSHLLTSQMHLPMRKAVIAFNDSNSLDSQQCMRFGAEQGFHNVLLYSGTLSRFLDVRVYPQGEGLVNIVGGFFGERKILRAFLAEWKVLRGDAPYKYVYNWNGEISPVVHQLDRFLQTELEGGYDKHMAVFQHLYG